ncbi:MAG: hypothetical protein M2R45_02536 [Verrucomicrobia subdivision 3 bacterium]|nr:hypothetical protein [Limisphaerales bacterium]MCS1414256.1 hypothetical protein [Limisphaerales bacterium]
MRTLYLDAFSGISGDMFLGAMIDLGISEERLTSELAKLRLEEYDLQIRRQQKFNIKGVKFDVILRTHSHGRNFSQIRALINESTLSDWVKENAIETFARVARAEGKAHGMPPDEVHFHEVGAVDSIMDIVGASIAIDLLDRPRVQSSMVVEGTGWVHCAHGRFPVPTMATLSILGERGVAVSQCDEPHELVTPTGAAILAQFAESFGPMNQLVASKIGYGLGTRDHKSRPNVLRAVIGEASAQSAESRWDTDTIGVVECNLDDQSPEILGYTFELALREGALDVFHSPIQMKKQRLGTLFTILCELPDSERFARLILRETSAFGVRTYESKRFKLRRSQDTVETPYGPVAVKIGRLEDKVIKVSPEYEACKTLAQQTGVSIQEIFKAVAAATANPTQNDSPSDST